MAVEVIDKIKPKNGGSFPIVEAVDVEVSDGMRLPTALTAKADASAIDAIQAQVDQIAQAAGTGSADTEVAQARVDNDGITYNTLKERIDTQMENVEQKFSEVNDEFSAITTHTKNIFEGDIEQGNINNSGADTTSNIDYYIRTKSFIEVDPTIVQEDDKCYINLSAMSKTNAFKIVFYDENKTYISYESKTSGIESETKSARSVYIVVPTTAKYVRFSSSGSSGSNTYSPSDIEKIQIEYGYVATAYEYPFTARDETARANIESATSQLNTKIEAVKVEYKAADVTLGNEIKAISEHTKNIFEGGIEQGGISNSGDNTDNLKNYFVRTNTFIPVDTSILQEDDQCYVIISWDSPMNAYRIFFYDEDKEYIDKVTGNSGTEGSTIRKDKFTVVPSTAKYIRFAFSGSSGSNTYTPNNISKIQVEYGYIQTEYVDPFTAKDEIARESIVSSMAVSNVVGNSLNVTPIGDNINVKLTVTNPPETSATWKVKHFNKNMADYASEATIATNFNDTTWFAVDLPMQKGEIYTISYKQEEAVSSATHNEVRIIQGGNNYLAPKNLKSGYVAFKFTAPVTATYSVGIYTHTLSNAIHISRFMVERGDKRTKFVVPESRLLQQSLTPSSDTINLSLTPYQGENNITAAASRGFAEVSCPENSVNATKRIMTQGVPWEYAMGDIICIGDSLTDGLYAPISVGKIKENYPYYLGRMLNANVLNTGTAGKYPSWFWENMYSQYDFSQYDCAILWLGTNGGMDIDDINIDGTEANCYKKIIEGIKSQKNDILIILGRVFVTGQKGSEVSFPSAEQTNEVIDYCGNYYNLPIIDFSDLSSGGNRLLHNLQDNTHFGKSGNIYIANRICEFMRSYLAEDITRVEFGILPKEQ